VFQPTSCRLLVLDIYSHLTLCKKMNYDTDPTNVARIWLLAPHVTVFITQRERLRPSASHLVTPKQEDGAGHGALCPPEGVGDVAEDGVHFSPQPFPLPLPPPGFPQLFLNTSLFTLPVPPPPRRRLPNTQRRLLVARGTCCKERIKNASQITESAVECCS